MSRIGELFRQKNRNVLNVYCTAGFPHLNSTGEVLMALQENGADLVELGIPFSDPLADGPVIQHSNRIALSNGMTLELLFEQLKSFRERIKIPVILMGYMNPVLQYGFENFCREAAASGIDGLIFPDLPEHEYTMQFGDVIRSYGLDFIFLVTPETSDERVRKLDSLSSGFLYAVSSSSTTGKPIHQNSLNDYLSRLQAMNLENPVLVGFGIRDKAGFQSVCTRVTGAIIGSAYIKALENSENVNATTKSFLSSVLG